MSYVIDRLSEQSTQKSLVIGVIQLIVRIFYPQYTEAADAISGVIVAHIAATPDNK